MNSDPEGLPDSDSIAGIEIPEPIDIQEIITEYDSLISAGLHTTNTVGAAVAIVYKNQVAYLKCFGVKKSRTNDSINENTVFRLASVSKPVTGVLAGMLAEDNIIDLNDKVKNYIPDLKLKHSNYTEELTIKNLLTHTTGLVPHAYDDLVELKMPLDKIVKRLYLANTISSPGSMYGY